MSVHFEFPPEILEHWGTFVILILTYYDLGRTNSNLEYYLAGPPGGKYPRWGATSQHFCIHPDMIYPNKKIRIKI